MSIELFTFLMKLMVSVILTYFEGHRGLEKVTKMVIFWFKCINGRLSAYVRYIGENHWEERTVRSLVYLCTMLAYTSVVLLFPYNYVNNIMSRKSTQCFQLDCLLWMNNILIFIFLLFVCVQAVWTVLLLLLACWRPSWMELILYVLSSCLFVCLAFRS